MSFLSIGEPFFCHDTFALGFPCEEPGNIFCMIFFFLVRKGKKEGNRFISHFSQTESKNCPERNIITF